MESEEIITAFKAHINQKEFPCVAARAALNKDHIRCLVVTHLACPHEDRDILQFLYDFVDNYRSSNQNFHSAAIIFKGPENPAEAQFDSFMWQRLQALADLDAQQYGYDPRVDRDPNSPGFSFSLKEEAFFVVGLHPDSSRTARQFPHPVLVFNPHAQFETLRQTGGYAKMQDIVRKRDTAYSGSVNPMLQDYGQASEVYQYSGRQHDAHWQCPLKIHHGNTAHHSAA